MRKEDADFLAQQLNDLRKRLEKECKKCKLRHSARIGWCEKHFFQPMECKAILKQKRKHG